MVRNSSVAEFPECKKTILKPTMSNKLFDQQREAFENAMQRKYAAVMFDLDGTLTEREQLFFPDLLKEKLVEIILKNPLAICTARGRGFPEERIAELLNISPDPKATKRNWYFLLENGSLGYFYNEEKEDYEEFYRVSWPDDKISRLDLFRVFEEELKNDFE